MKARGWLVTLLLAALLMGAGWWFGSPWWTLYQMKQAADRRDFAALSAYIDYPALRADAAAQLGRKVREGSVSDLVPRAGRFLGAAILANGLARELASEAGIAELLADAEPGEANQLRIRAEDLAIRHAGIDQFWVASKTGQGPRFLFRRHGLGWKLAGLRLPDDFTSWTFH